MKKRTYNQFCPVAMGAEIFAERWTPLVLRELMAGSCRFSDLHRGVPRMSRSLLVQRLRGLEDAGLVQRRQAPGGNTATYHLTEAGGGLAPVIDALGKWGYHWLQTELRPEHLDSVLLMWDLQRNLHQERLPKGRTVISFFFPDSEIGHKRFWLVLTDGQVDLCFKNPGHEVDLELETSILIMARIWLGDIPLNDALRDGRVKLEGPRKLTSQFGSWLALSGFAGETRHRPPMLVQRRNKRRSASVAQG